MTSRTYALTALLLLTACQSTPTYFSDVQPIIQAKCQGCHNPDGIGPFSLQTAEEVVARKSLIRSAVASRTMPPWPPSSACGDYRNDRSLSEAQIKTVTAWVDSGAPLGDAAHQKTGKSTIGMSRVDLTLQMPTSYTPEKSPDDYRCFLVDWTPTTVKFVTGLGVQPGNPRIVHHVIAFIAPPDQLAQYQTLDDNEAGPGWTCFGGPGNGTRAQWLGAWAPGALGADFPAGTGVRVEPGSKIVIQVHYNTANALPAPDRSSVQVEVADTVEKQAYVTPFTNPTWVAGGMTIPAEMSDQSYDFSFDITPRLNKLTKGLFVDNQPVTIYSSTLHMHTRGTQIRSKILHADGTEDCQVDIPKWNFSWQGSYTFGTPKVMKPGDQLYLECHWDNTSANQPVVNGAQLTSRDVSWGEGTADEMCLEILYMTQG